MSPLKLSARTTVRTIAIVALLAWGAACGEAATDAAIPVPVTQLPCSSTSAEGTWESVSWPPAPACAWFDFQGDRAYTISHGLGRVPRAVLGYIAFSPDGYGASIAAGDTFLVDAATTTTVTVRNATSEDFFLRLVLQ